MNLLRFRVRDFRAVVDTDWIDCQQVTAFVGSNESGKTTILMALMRLVDLRYKFNVKSLAPEEGGRSAFSGLSRLTTDMPLDRVKELFPRINDTVFIDAVFSLDESMRLWLAKKGGREFKPVDTLRITKTYGGTYDLPQILPQFPTDELRYEVLQEVLSKLPQFMYFKEVTEIKSEIDLVELAYKLAGHKKVKELTSREAVFASLLNYLDIWQKNLINSISQIYGKLDTIDDSVIDFNEIFERIPMFKERFSKGFALLSEEFKKWWGNGEISIHYEPYKKGVKIVLKDERGDSFLMENRSTGFRRFFSQFLAFSVMAKQDFENAILLFDEAGSALHPKMQRKFVHFFSELGKNSQVLYNTHSSYMLPITEMNRVRIVYKDTDGHVKVTKDLSLNADNSNEESLYVAEASLSMYLAQTTLVGCLPITVLSADDMFYLQIIRNVLIAKGKLNTVYETLIFSAGLNGIDATSQIFSANEELPLILLSSDGKAREVKQRLLAGVYNQHKDRVYELSDFVPDTASFAELLPPGFFRLFGMDYLKSILGNGFEYNNEQPLLKQVHEYAEANGIALPPLWRVMLAKNMKINSMMLYKNTRIKKQYIKTWTKILKTLVRP